MQNGTPKTEQWERVSDKKFIRRSTEREKLRSERKLTFEETRLSREGLHYYTSDGAESDYWGARTPIKKAGRAE